MLELPRDMNELVEVMNRLNYNPSMNDLQECFTVNKRHSTGNGKMSINIVPFVKLIFKAYDKDNSGYISSSEWSDALNKMSGDTIGKNQAKEIFKLETYDLNQDGKLSFEEFVNYIQNTTTELSHEQRERLKALFPDSLNTKVFFESLGMHLTEEELDQININCEKEASGNDNMEYNFENICKALFKFTDKNNDGFISASEMQFLIGKIMGENETVNVEDAIALISVVDENDDGKLDYREFISMFVKLTEWKENTS